jgi:hypothetical protein
LADEAAMTAGNKHKRHRRNSSEPGSRSHAIRRVKGNGRHVRQLQRAEQSYNSLGRQ